MMATLKTYVDDIRLQFQRYKWWYLTAGGLILLALFIGMAL